MKSQSRLHADPKTGRQSFATIHDVVEYPDLLNVQLESFEAFLQERINPAKRKNKGLQQVFLQNFPITDTRENYLLEFVEYYVEKPKYTVRECQERGLTFAVPMKAKLRLSAKAENGEGYSDTIEEVVYLGNLPYMTDRGTFIINGAERVIVSQIVRSPGIYYKREVDTNGKRTFSATLIPNRGAWLKFETDVNDVIYVKIDKNRKLPATTLLTMVRPLISCSVLLPSGSVMLMVFPAADTNKLDKMYLSLP